MYQRVLVELAAVAVAATKAPTLVPELVDRRVPDAAVVTGAAVAVLDCVPLVAAVNAINVDDRPLAVAGAASVSAAIITKIRVIGGHSM